MKRSGASIRLDIVEPDCVVTTIESTTEDGSNMQGIRNTVLNLLEVLIPFKSIPCRRVMNANKKQIEIREKQKHSKDTARNKRDRKT